MHCSVKLLLWTVLVVKIRLQILMYIIAAASLCLMTYYGLLNSIINAIDDSVINSDDSRIDLKLFNIKEQEKKNFKVMCPNFINFDFR